jgi:CRISPR-associated endoribonuclease Cas6
MSTFIGEVSILLTDLFISQVENNLLKKYKEYQNLKSAIEGEELTMSLLQQSSFSLFQKFKFKKQISTRLFMKGFDQVIIGTVWEFSFSIDSNKDIIQFALDAGLGERNSLGFGFMNTCSSYPITLLRLTHPCYPATILSIR